MIPTIRCMTRSSPISGIWPVFLPGLLTLTLRGAASIMQERRNQVGKPAQTSRMTERCINEAGL
jgi:hypothetical protein